MFNPAMVRAEIRLSISDILVQQKDRIRREEVQEGRIFANGAMSLQIADLR